MAIPEFLQALLTATGPSGYETPAANVWRESARSFANEVTSDTVGSSVARVPASDGAPLVARWHKKFTRRLLQPAPLSAAELDESFDCFGTEDFRAGYRAFLTKTRPAFEGR